MAISINETLANQQVEALGSSLDSGFIDIYDGTLPADPTDPPDGTLLVSCALDADAYGSPSGGSETANSSPTGIAVATGTATYAQQRNGANTQWMYGTVTATGGGGDVELPATSITVLDSVTITTSTITQPMS